MRKRDLTDDYDNMLVGVHKIERVILSCVTFEQLISANRMAWNFHEKYVLSGIYPDDFGLIAVGCYDAIKELCDVKYYEISKNNLEKNNKKISKNKKKKDEKKK